MSARFEQIRQLFVDALQRPEDEVKEYLAQRCEGDPELLREVQSLLRHSQRVGSFLEEPLSEGALRTSSVRERPLELLKPGDVLGDFEIVQFLARGGLGEVYEAAQVSLDGRRVAVKVIPYDQVEQRSRSRFLRESQLAARLHHPHLVSILSSGEDESKGLLYYAMRLVPGPTMAQLIRDWSATQNAPGGDVCRCIVQRVREVAEGLAVLHRKNLLHRDVKPANIILEPGEDGDPVRGSAVLVDFGLVRHRDQCSGQSTLWATPSYAALECLLRKNLDPSSDVFSLGLTLYDLLTGRSPDQRPYPLLDPLPKLSQWRQDLDPDLEAIVARATEPDRRWRYQDGQELADDLRRWESGDLVEARRTSRWEKARRWVQRNPAPILRVVARGAVALVLISVLTFSAVWGLGVYEASHSAAKAWERADLQGLESSLDKLPQFLDPLFLSEAIREGLAGHSLNLKQRDVLSVWANQGEDEALIRAASYVERDGPQESPFLLRVLLEGLEREGARDLPLTLLARVYFERPDRSRADTAASARACVAFRELIEENLIGVTPLYALTGLSGAGTIADLQVIADWLTRRDAMQVRLTGEDFSLALRAMERLVLRSHRAGRDRERSYEVTDGLLELMNQLAEGRECELALVDLFKAVAFQRRAFALPALTTLPRLQTHWTGLRLLAARRDPELEASILRGDLDLSGLSPLVVSEFAFVVGCYDSREMELAARRSLQIKAEKTDVDAEPLLEEFEVALGVSSEERSGIRLDQEPAAGTHLGDRLSIDPEANSRLLQSVALSAGEKSRPDLFAMWKFIDDGVHTWGATVGEVSVTRGESHLDGQQRDKGFLDLNAAGVSSVKVKFFLRRHDAGLPYLQLEVRKSLRRLLPRKGEAYLDIFLGGERKHRLAVDSDHEHFPLLPLFPLPRLSRDTDLEYEIEVTLTSDSTTPVWLYAARIVLDRERK